MSETQPNIEDNDDFDGKKQKIIVLYRVYMYNPHNNTMFLMDHEYNVLHTERHFRMNEAYWQRSPSPPGCILRPQRLEFKYTSMDDVYIKIPDLDLKDAY
jgi:hypothetical protein